MKSVTFSEVVPVGAAAPVRGGAVRFALMLALGLPTLILGAHQFDPSAPLPYIVAPVLAGAVAPLWAVLSGKLEVTTRFDAHHLLRTLDSTLGALGYEKIEQHRGALRYRTGSARWLRKEIAVTVREHSIEVVGPVSTLRALQAGMAR
jgi:hypothetical protein